MSDSSITKTHADDHPTLSVFNLRCVRGDNLLFEGLNFELNKGRCLHVIGSNGSGKTSLLRIICGLNSSETGHISFDGEPILNVEDVRANIAYIGHKDGLKNELTALENLRFQQRLDGAINEDHLDNCLARLKILRCADLPAQSLSFGQRRRLSFARLLLNTKRVWILDEPFTGIDAQGRELIEDLCVRHLQNNGSILMTHHQSLEASELSEYRDELHLERAKAS